MDEQPFLEERRQRAVDISGLGEGPQLLMSPGAADAEQKKFGMTPKQPDTSRSKAALVPIVIATSDPARSDIWPAPFAFNLETSARVSRSIGAVRGSSTEASAFNAATTWGGEVAPHSASRARYQPAVPPWWPQPGPGRSQR